MSIAQCHSCLKLFPDLQTHRCGLGRQRKKRLLKNQIKKVKFLFKPQGVPITKLNTIKITAEELEILRLKNIENFNQTEIATKLSLSQSTLARTVQEINQKITLALVNGYAIKICNN